jgi:arginyl-tRNA synthetase
LYLEIQRRVRERLTQEIAEAFGFGVEAPVLDTPPTPELGDLSTAACFELAKQLRRPPRKIAEELAARLLPIEGVERVSVAGAGYINFHFDRAEFAMALNRLRTFPPAPRAGVGKILVEHTSINPNKAAHIGHLRNAVLGDTFVRLLRFRGYPVEIENYIDNTGVQVADVVVGFQRLEKKTASDVRALISDSGVRFDYSCWDLYARVFQHYEENPESLAWRAEVLKTIEDGEGESAAIAEAVSTAITRRHLETMDRLNVRYDLLAQESEILRLDFWTHAFQLLKETGAIRFEDAGKNQGCWVMSFDEEAQGETDKESGGEEVKIIVRSNGTVTYVGKDIAYHLWKFGLLGKDFGYQPFHRYADGHTAWRTATDSAPNAPRFGHAAEAYAVIDTRQSYLQRVVAAAFRVLGFREQADRLHHFAYEVVGLSPACAEEMGISLTDEERERTYIEVSGRKGLGIKADDLVDTLIERAFAEVAARQMTSNAAEQQAAATRIAVAALRYFMLKYSRRIIIAFDFKEALAFEGETGPYLQYTVVRARNIFRRYRELDSRLQPERLGDELGPEGLQQFLAEEDGLAFWGMTLQAAQLEALVDQAIATAEPSVVAKYAFRLAQSFNNFYHHHHILAEPDVARQKFLLFLVFLVEKTLSRTLDILGIEIPEKM